ncbi:MAG TPA: hypothetical protein PLJ32_08765, partial [Kiritimatiellia bacterium]|nr:hypothetical protein [Kiritimatiellia bacterium]
RAVEPSTLFGFKVSSKSGSLSGSVSLSVSGTSTRDPRHSTRDDGRLSPAYAPVSKTPSIALATKGWDEEFKKSVGRTVKPSVYGALLEFYPFNCSFWVQ